VISALDFASAPAMASTTFAAGHAARSDVSFGVSSSSDSDYRAKMAKVGNLARRSLQSTSELQTTPFTLITRTAGYKPNCQ
jgi:hypothetical protein